MTGRLTGKVTIITGAAQGIGAALARGFAREGARLVIADIIEGQELIEEIEASGGEAFFIRTDVTEQAQCDDMAAAAMERFGSIDVLINNAALYGSLVLKPFSKISTEEWNQVMQVNTTGPFHCVKSVFPYMKKSGGKIINISSQSVLQGIPGMAHYIASKGAVMAFTRALARELGPYKINVNSIAPGFTHSAGSQSLDQNKSFPMGPIEDTLKHLKCLQRESVPEDLVGTALFLASQDSAFITGQMINHDGGICMY